MKLLLHVVQDYSFEILRPLQQAAISSGDEVAWFVVPELRARLNGDELLLSTLGAVLDWQPDAVFVPGNDVPSVFPGLKVQVFHGFGIEKKGHFRIRGMFQLYCTHGPLTTSVFERLAEKHKNFVVRETGWPKVDPLFHNPEVQCAETAQLKVLYAPTFSPRLTSASHLLPEVQRLLTDRDWSWRVKFHPKMDAQMMEPWEAISGPNYQMVGGGILPHLQWADVLLTDTSSVAAEFMLLDKPVVSYRNRKPGDHLINITQPSELEPVLDDLVAGVGLNQDKRRLYAQNMHPYGDGLSSQRVLQAVREVLDSKVLNQLKPLPRSRLRQRKIKKALGL